MSASANRRAYIDWMRGLSVLFMIEAHTFDAWTRARRTAPRRPIKFWVNFIGGLAAPMFLFLAGVSVAMAGASRERRTGDRDGGRRGRCRSAAGRSSGWRSCSASSRGS